MNATETNLFWWYCYFTTGYVDKNTTKIRYSCTRFTFIISVVTEEKNSHLLLSSCTIKYSHKYSMWNNHSHILLDDFAVVCWIKCDLWLWLRLNAQGQILIVELFKQFFYSNKSLEGKVIFSSFSSQTNQITVMHVADWRTQLYLILIKYLSVCLSVCCLLRWSMEI